jgi:hypothetical protein
MAKRRNRKVLTAEETLDMSKYVDSAAVVPDCDGCDKIFNFEWETKAEDGQKTLIKARKCLAYSNPASKWPKKGESFATKEMTVRIRDAKGKAIALENQILPILPKMCPLATHVSLPEIVEETSKARAGQQKQSRRR